jgi:hypothetical protein
MDRSQTDNVSELTLGGYRGCGAKGYHRESWKDFRRGLAAMNDLVVAFGRNLSSAEKR